MKKLALLFLLPLSVLAQASWDYPLFDRGHLAVNPSSNYYEFESTWNGEPNYYLAAGELDSFGEPALSKFFVGDRYVFYVKNNWVDTVRNDTDRDYKVFGLNRGDYTINISRTSGNCKVLGLVLHR